MDKYVYESRCLCWRRYICRTCEPGQHKHKRNGSVFFFCQRTNRRLYPVRLWLLTKIAREVEEKHCACVGPCAFAYLTRVNILVLMLISLVWTSLYLCLCLCLCLYLHRTLELALRLTFCIVASECHCGKALNAARGHVPMRARGQVVT